MKKKLILSISILLGIGIAYHSHTAATEKAQTSSWSSRLAAVGNSLASGAKTAGKFVAENAKGVTLEGTLKNIQQTAQTTRDTAQAIRETKAALAALQEDVVGASHELKGAVFGEEDAEKEGLPKTRHSISDSSWLDEEDTTVARKPSAKKPSSPSSPSKQQQELADLQKKLAAEEAKKKQELATLAEEEAAAQALEQEEAEELRTEAAQLALEKKQLAEERLRLEEERLAMVTAKKRLQEEAAAKTKLEEEQEKQKVVPQQKTTITNNLSYPITITIKNKALPIAKGPKQTVSINSLIPINTPIKFEFKKPNNITTVINKKTTEQINSITVDYNQQTKKISIILENK